MDKQWLNQLPINPINSVKNVTGGDVNDAYEIENNKQKYFLLVQPNTSKDFFITEAAGLKDLKTAGVTVPDVYHLGEINGDTYLLISFLEEGGSGSYAELAKMVAKMHQTYNNRFGYKYPHHGAGITFNNNWTDSWIELFVERRLDKLRDEIIQSDKWTQKQIDIYEQTREIIIKELSNHHSKPSLLHGDLWGGNHMFLTNSTPALFDPAPFYGDREFDIGITTAFRGYPKEFYETYQKTLPLSEGYEKRLDYYRLYLFMVHLHKFGSIYENRVNQIMQSILS